MDRNSPKPPESLSARINGRRNAAQPFGTRPTSRKNAGNPESKENSRENVGVVASDTEAAFKSSIPRASTNGHHRTRTTASASSYSMGASESPRDSRLPRPKTVAPITTTDRNSPSQQNHSQKQPFRMRQPMGLKAAFKLAQEQEAANDGTISLQQAFNMATAEADRGIDGSPSPAPRSYRSRRESHDANTHNTFWSRRGSELSQQLQQFDRNHQLVRGSAPLNGLFASNRVGPKITETGHTLAKKASDSSLTASPVNRRPSQPGSDSRSNRLQNNARRSTRSPEGSVKSDMVDQDDPVPSIEFESATSDERPSPIPRPANSSPEKSYNWQLDADFTAGDLQISASPRIRTAKTNGDSARMSPSYSSPNRDTPRFRRSNNRLEQIRAREAEVERMALPEDESSYLQRKNTKLDEIRFREMEALSRRAMATSRLDEIKVRNSEARSESPEAGRPSSKGLNGTPGPRKRESEDPPKDPPASDQKREQPSDTPNTTFRDADNEKATDPPKDKYDVSTKNTNSARDASLEDDSQELLRQLARATSSSPSPPASLEKTEKSVPVNGTSSSAKPDESDNNWRRLTAREERRSRNMDAKSSRERPTVGFVGIRRDLSSDSLQEKRASRGDSEVDPTDRIEAEMKLFAPLDNYSEKSSVRAPSPVPSEPIEETPRPNKSDPLMQPTPRVTGAFVDTPATVKVKAEDDSGDKVASDSLLYVSNPSRRLRGRNSGEPSAEQGIKGEDSDSGKSTAVAKARSSSVPSTRRTSSVSRRRRRPVVNTAKPASVRDDIRAILRSHQIDDSTLEDFDERLARHEIDHEELEKMVLDTKLKVEDDADNPEMTDGERELQAYIRMSKSLKPALEGIRTAKQGIERLEDKVSHTEHKAFQVLTDLDASSSKSVPHVAANPVDPSAVLISIPALWRRKPRFRLTKLGIFSLFFAIWWILELVFCHYYAGPQYECTPHVPCDWSPNEPYYPYTMPFMLDEWATGGKGRELALRIGEELGDITADISDWITDTDFTQHDQRYMNVWERKRHRRRLRKHGLVPKWVEPPDYKLKYTEWQAARIAQEEAEELGYDTNDESMSGDERVRW